MVWSNCQTWAVKMIWDLLYACLNQMHNMSNIRFIVSFIILQAFIFSRLKNWWPIQRIKLFVFRAQLNNQTVQWIACHHGRCFKFLHHFLLDRISPLYQRYSYSLSVLASKILLLYYNLSGVLNKCRKEILFVQASKLQF